MSGSFTLDEELYVKENSRVGGERWSYCKIIKVNTNGSSYDVNVLGMNYVLKNVSPSDLSKNPPGITFGEIQVESLKNEREFIIKQMNDIERMDKTGESVYEDYKKRLSELNAMLGYIGRGGIRQKSKKTRKSMKSRKTRKSMKSRKTRKSKKTRKTIKSRK
jgi:hypothetical protein